MSEPSPKTMRLAELVRYCIDHIDHKSTIAQREEIARVLGEKDHEREVIQGHFAQVVKRAEAAEAKVKELEPLRFVHARSMAQAEQRGHDAGEAEARAIFQGEYQRGRDEEEAACVKRGHLTSADLAKMQAQARAEGIETAAKVADHCNDVYVAEKIRALLPAKAPAE